MLSHSSVIPKHLEGF